MSATIEEVVSDAGSDNEVAGGNLDKFQSRAERKARKALIGLGLKKVAGINRVVLRRPKNVRSPVFPSYVVIDATNNLNIGLVRYRCPRRLQISK